jgi:hypothetical protein
LKRLDPPIYHIDLFAENGKPALNDNLSEGSRSEYQAVSVNGMLNANALPFIEELMRSPDRELSAYGHKLKHNFVNHVTHDGLPQPKKKNRLRRFFSIFRRPAGAAGR